MTRYIGRLVRCGYTYTKARELCRSFVRNLSLFDLECFVTSTEATHNVDKV